MERIVSFEIHTPMDFWRKKFAFITDETVNQSGVTFTGFTDGFLCEVSCGDFFQVEKVTFYKPDKETLQKQTVSVFGKDSIRNFQVEAVGEPTKGGHRRAVDSIQDVLEILKREISKPKVSKATKEALERIKGEIVNLPIYVRVQKTGGKE